jgi:hypothetical protein
MQFRVLGPFEASGKAGLVDLPDERRRGLLACLVVHAGQPMSTDRLGKAIWVEGGSERAARTVPTYVSQLRKLLRGEAARLETRPAGYAFGVDPADVDAHRFELAVIAAAGEPDPAVRLAVLEGALQSWWGPPLLEFAGAGWADRVIRRLEAFHLQALQRRFASLMELGRSAEASPSWSRWLPLALSTRGSGRSSCTRCTAAAGRPMRWAPISGHDAIWWANWASSPAASSPTSNSTSSTTTVRSSRPQITQRSAAGAIGLVVTERPAGTPLRSR